MTSGTTPPTNDSGSTVEMICDFIRELYKSKTKAEKETEALRKLLRRQGLAPIVADTRTVAEKISQMVRAIEDARTRADKKVEDLESELKKEKEEVVRLRRDISQLDATSFISISVTESNHHWEHLVMLRIHDDLYDRFEDEFGINLREYDLTRTCEIVSKLVVLTAEKK